MCTQCGALGRVTRVLSLRYIKEFFAVYCRFPTTTCFTMYLLLFKDAHGVLITCILCCISLLLTSFTAINLAAKLTGQLDFDPAAMLAYTSADLRTTCWYRLDVR